MQHRSRHFLTIISRAIWNIQKVRLIILATALAAASIASAAGPDALYIPQSIPFEDEAAVDPKVFECPELGAQFAESIEKYGRENGFNIIRTNEEVEGKGNYLNTSIVTAVSGGNAAAGHWKTVSASATIVIGGVEAGSTNVQRNSMGGAGAVVGVKRSCSVLADTVNTLGNDIAEWLLRNHSDPVVAESSAGPVVDRSSDAPEITYDELIKSSAAFAKPHELYVEMAASIPDVGVEAEVSAGDQMLTQSTGSWKECITPKLTYTKETNGWVGWTYTHLADEPICKTEPGDKYYWPTYANAHYLPNDSSRHGSGKSERVNVRWDKKGSGYRLCSCQSGICGYCIKKLPEDAVEYGESYVSTENALQQIITYSGRNGNILTFAYSEFKNDFARETINTQLTMDLGESAVLEYRGAIIEVVEASDSSIRYKVTRNFQQ